jgi:hypothetical protein
LGKIAHWVVQQNTIYQTALKFENCFENKLLPCHSEGAIATEESPRSQTRNSSLPPADKNDTNEIVIDIDEPTFSLPAENEPRGSCESVAGVL